MTRKILLADDDAAVRHLLGRVLESERYEVVLARTGFAAVLKFRTDPPDLVLLDLVLPDKDGWAAFGLMNSAHPMVPFIVITAKPEQYPRAVEFGVDAFMEKPLHLPLLLATVRDLLAESEADRVRRLTRPDFKTRFLKPHAAAGAAEADPCITEPTR